MLNLRARRGRSSMIKPLSALALLVGLTACGAPGPSTTPEPSPTPAPSPAPSPNPAPSPTPAPNPTPAPSPAPNSYGVGSLIEAEDYNSLSFGFENPDGNVVGYFDDGDALCYDNVGLDGVQSLVLHYARGVSDPGAVRITVDGPEGTVLGEMDVPATADWNTYADLSIGLAPTAGEHMLCVVGALGGGIFNLDYMTLSAAPGSATPPPTPMPTPTPTPTPAPTPAPGGGVAPITVQGNQVLFGGQPRSIAGMSLFWSQWDGGYYNADVVRHLKTDWNAELVRAAMGVEESGGYINLQVPNSRQDNLDRVTTVVDAAIEQDMYVIIDWHTHHAHENNYRLAQTGLNPDPNTYNIADEAVEFFDMMSARYGEYPHVIYEIYNEPLRVSWSNDIKPYAERVIQTIRANDPDNLIIVGTPNWSQDVDAAAQDPIRGAGNLAYTLHFYANTHRFLDGSANFLKGKVESALSQGIPLFVTEWGTTNADGGNLANGGDGGFNATETNAWLDFLKANNISHANWSLNNKVEASSALGEFASANGGWTDGDLTQSGRLVRGAIRNWNSR